LCFVLRTFEEKPNTAHITTRYQFSNIKEEYVFSGEAKNKYAP
jgi:hypothetical protein